MPGPLSQRTAGVLLHPTSLPGTGYCGTFGGAAHQFLDLLAAAGLQLWQMLPLGPTHADGCPYQSLSVHAGNPDLIDLEWLADHGLLAPADAAAGARTPAAKRQALDSAADSFVRQAAESGSPLAASYRDFIAESAFWLEDYVRFRAFRQRLQGAPWTSWPEALRHADGAACAELARELEPRLAQLRFRQFVFHAQWRELRRRAHARGIRLFGDIPIYVHHESADVWAHQSEFLLDTEGHPLSLTGVPPDYFCAQGQLWGNPQYDWNYMEKTAFRWWLQRFASAARLYDVARIDHFRALDAYWEVAAGATSAKEGHWVAAPGRALLRQVRERFPALCLVAENLGTISPDVEALRAEFELPGMLVLQFAFDGNPENPYLNHRHSPQDVVYTGTHDNDTTLGWFQSLDDATRAAVYRYYGNPAQDMPWMLIRQALASRANTAMVPWQDYLGLDGRHRMNTPGTREGNWQWRFTWQQVPGDLARRIRDLLAECQRLPPHSGDALRAAGAP